jgi:hypothetical protein
MAQHQLQQQRLLQQQQQTRQALMAQQAFQQQGMGNMALVNGVPMAMVNQMNPNQLAALRQASAMRSVSMRHILLPTLASS